VNVLFKLVAIILIPQRLIANLFQLLRSVFGVVVTNTNEEVETY